MVAKTIKNIFVALIGCMLLLSCESKKTSTESENNSATELQERIEIRSIDSEEAMALLEKDRDIVLLDVRTPEEFANGHVTGAKNIDFQGDDFPGQLQLLDPNQEYMVYCAIGGRSGKTLKQMEKMGFKTVFNVTDGFPGLSDKGAPVSESE